MRTSGLLAAFSIAALGGCAALTGLDSLDEVACAGNCDGGPAGGDASSGGVDGSAEPGADARSDAGAGAADSGAADSGAPVDSGGDAGQGGGGIVCGSMTCGAGVPCCARAGNTLCASSATKGCPAPSYFVLQCDQTSDCATGDACCLDLQSRTSSCVAAAACPLGGSQLVRMCKTGSLVADLICGAGFDCLTSGTLPQFNTCQ